MSAALHEHDLGLTWVADETMARASHALVDDGRVWLVDPSDDAAALARAGELGEVVAVLQLLDRHPRSCERLAQRFAVPHERLPRALPGTPFEVVPVLRLPVWREVALWWPARRALVVAEMVGTASVWAVGPAAAGVHPYLRVLPPAALRRFEPEHLLVGHGTPLHGESAARGLREALARSRRDLPRLALKSRDLLRTGRDLTTKP